MHARPGASSLHYRQLRDGELDFIVSLDLDPEHIDRFLGPLPGVVAAVRAGLAHALVAFEARGALVGFYVVHPAPRDGSAWWLGWFAVDRRWQGQGLGTEALRHALRHMEAIPACRRIRLLVAVDNARACRMYERAGFRALGGASMGDEVVLEFVLPSKVSASQLKRENVAAAAARARRVFRHRRLRLAVGPHPAWVIGVERGPPGLVHVGRMSSRQADHDWIS